MKKGDSKLNKSTDEIISKIKKGIPYTKIAIQHGVHYRTMLDFIRLRDLKKYAPKKS